MSSSKNRAWHYLLMHMKLPLRVAPRMGADANENVEVSAWLGVYLPSVKIASPHVSSSPSSLVSAYVLPRL